MHTLPDQVLFYDGLCGLCDHLVQFILERDRNGRIFFVPIQSELARACLKEKGIPEAEFTSLSTVYFMNQGIVYRRSRAIFKVFSFLPAPWCFLKWLSVIPVVLTDPGYRVVARVRYAVFGKLDQCRIPTPEQRTRFL